MEILAQLELRHVVLHAAEMHVIFLVLEATTHVVNAECYCLRVIASRKLLPEAVVEEAEEDSTP